jgi:hypothetical protein
MIQRVLLGDCVSEVGANENFWEEGTESERECVSEWVAGSE